MTAEVATATATTRLVMGIEIVKIAPIVTIVGIAQIVTVAMGAETVPICWIKGPCNPLCPEDTAFGNIDVSVPY